MKDIADIRVTNTRIFSPDVIPFGQLVTSTNLKNFNEDFEFKDVRFEEDESKNIISIIFKTGEFKHAKKVYPVALLSIQSNVIDFVIHANSTIATNFYKSIENKLSAIDINNQFRKNRNVVTTSETSCVVTLDFDYHELFSKTFNNFMSQDASKTFLSTFGHKVDIDITPKQLVLEVNYKVNVKSKPYSLGTKAMRIEPRWGIDTKERRYFTVSPCDSKMHLNLLTSLEKKFNKTK